MNIELCKNDASSHLDKLNKKKGGETIFSSSTPSCVKEYVYTFVLMRISIKKTMNRLYFKGFYDEIIKKPITITLS